MRTVSRLCARVDLRGTAASLESHLVETSETPALYNQLAHMIDPLFSAVIRLTAAFPFYDL